jgi:Fe-S-cluster containining protein
MHYAKDLERAKSQKSRNKKRIRGWQKSKHEELDAKFHKLHEVVFKEVDCLKCANCCKTTSPIFRDIDIKRIAHFLRISEANFIQQNLRLDEEGDFVLQNSPCLFLQKDNKCSIYNVRPKACREYPHTNRKNIFQILDLTYKNSLICPAVARIFDRMA